MNRHERIEELAAARALGGLESPERVELERLQDDHGPDCAECRRIDLEFAEVAGRLPFALHPEPVPPGMEDRVTAVARGLGPALETGPRRRRAGSLRTGARRAAVAAAAAVLVVAGGVGGYLVGRSGAPSPAARDLVSFLSHGGARVAAFRGSGTGNLSVAYRPGERRAFVVGAGLPAAPSGHVYELWLLPSHGTPVPSGTFEGTGGQLLVLVTGDLSRATRMAVTVERAPGARQPTRAPIFSAPITA